MKSAWILAVAAFAGACASDRAAGPAGDGMTRILLTDSPFPYDSVESVDIHVVRVAVSRTADTGASSSEQDWITVAEPNQVFNLLELRDGETALLGEVELEAGEYPALRMVINTSGSSVAWRSGEQAAVDWQHPGEITLNALVEGALAIPEAGGRIVVDFDVGRSFVSVAEPASGFLFIPWIRAVNDVATGEVAGTVYGWTIEGESWPLDGGVVAVYRGDTTQSPGTWSLAASAPIGQDGRYVVRYLAPRDYVVQATPPPGTDLAAATRWPVPVSAGVRTTLDIQLDRADQGTGGTLYIVGDTGLAVGESATYFAAIVDASGDTVFTDDVSWFTSDTSIVRITMPDGMTGSQTVTVTGLAEGYAAITATSGSLSDEVYVRVGDDGGGGGTGGPVATVALNPASQTVQLGDSSFIEAILRDAEGRLLSDRSVTWAMSRPDVLRIDGEFGHWLVFTGIAADSVTVTATSEGKSGTALVTVRN